MNMITGETKNLCVMKLTDEEFDEQLDKGFFDHFAIKNIFNKVDPLLQILVENNSVINNFNECCITSFIKNGSIYYFTSLDRNTNIILKSKEEINNWFKQIKNDNVLYFTNKTDTATIELLTKQKVDFCLTKQRVQVVLNTESSNVENYRELHIKMLEEIGTLKSLNKITQIPIGNINEETVLDTFYYKELYKSDIVIKENLESTRHYTHRNELILPGYFDRVTAQLELNYTAVLAILEYEEFLQNKLFEGVKTVEFVFLQNFCKNILIKSAEGEIGATIMLNMLDRWLKKDSKYLSFEVKETICLLQQQYLVNLVQRLKNIQIDVFFASKEIIYLNTKKKTLKEAIDFIDHLKKEIKNIDGYDLLNITTLKLFEKMIFVDPETFFYLNEGEIRQSTDKYKMPQIFLEKYFSEDEIDNYFVYDIITIPDIITAKMMLRILSYKRETHGLVSNCYRLLNIIPQKEEETFDLNLTVFCRNCNCENYIRKNCIKCLSELNIINIEEECEDYLNFCCYQQAEGDRYCLSCGKIEERLLKEYCCCGGKFEFQNFTTTYAKLKKFVNTKTFTNKVAQIELNFSN